MSPSRECFVFNRYVPLVRLDDRFLWELGPGRELELPASAAGVLTAVRTGRPVTIPELREELSAEQVVRLFAERVLVPPPAAPAEDRYSRTRGYFSTVGGQEAAEALRNAAVLVLGAGAIGSHVCWMLAALGVRQITVVDFDVAEESNLNRQLLYTVDDVGRPKVEALRDRLDRVNPEVRVIPVRQRVGGPEDVLELLSAAGAAILVKAIDTPEAVTSWINAACVAARTPYVQGGFVARHGVVGPSYVPGATACWDCFSGAAHPDLQHVQGGGGTTPYLTEIVAGKIVRDLVSILAGRGTAHGGSMELYDEHTNASTATVDTFVGRCATCGAEHPGGRPATPRLGVEIAYLAACVLAPLLNGRVPGPWTLTVVALVQLLLLAVPGPERAARLAFLGGGAYAAILVALTVRDHPELLGIGAGMDAVGLVQTVMLTLLIAALVIAASVWSCHLLRLVAAVCRGGWARLRPVHREESHRV